jgi:hypothetical protein
MVILLPRHFGHNNDESISKIIGRSVKAIKAKRYRLNKVKAFTSYENISYSNR